jgi:protein phosphatase
MAKPLARAMQVVWNTRIGLKSTTNQDRAFVDQKLRFFILADGVGGNPGGGVASSIAINAASRILSSQIDQVKRLPELESLISRSIQTANQDIQKLSSAERRLAHMASTITIAVIHNQNLAFANLGDTRVYAMTAQGLVALSHDHNAATELAGNSLLTERQIRSHPFRNILTRALGSSAEASPFIQTVDLNAVTMLLLCTDGVWSVLQDSALEDILRHKATLADKCLTIMNMAVRSGSTDDLTCILVDFIS